MVEDGLVLRKNNLVITNGSFAIPEWRKDTHFAVSLDGTEKIHDEIRGRGTYKRAKANILDAISKGIPVSLLYCINSINIDCIPSFMKEWKDKKFEAIAFTVWVPIKNRNDYLALNNRQRDQIVSLLLKLKKEYKQLIYNTELMIELIRGKYGKSITDNCPMNVLNKKSRVHCVHLCNNGFVRIPCSLGEDADCLECRSVTTMGLYAGKVLNDKKSLIALFRMYHAKPHNKPDLEVTKL
ncbi:hypothetical protein ACFL5N_01945 [bacterium]